jgi:hypothetical protein
MYLSIRSEKLNRILMIRQNIDNGLSWLSTLGGAFSSLGDEFDNCVSFLLNLSKNNIELYVII